MGVIEHVSIGVRDLQRSAAFYDAVLAPLGYGRVFAREGAVGYGARKPPAFWLIDVSGRETGLAVPGIGVHFGFSAPDRAAVDAFHAAAIASGGRDAGAPGPRPRYMMGFYGAFVLDPDGYKIEAVFRAEGD
jgi:catechol 2,3-dioxygenase-like lactoylglutathione lyase family enzyme